MRRCWVVDHGNAREPLHCRLEGLPSAPTSQCFVTVCCIFTACGQIFSHFNLDPSHLRAEERQTIIIFEPRGSGLITRPALDNCNTGVCYWDSAHVVCSLLLFNSHQEGQLYKLLQVYRALMVILVILLSCYHKHKSLISALRADKLLALWCYELYEAPAYVWLVILRRGDIADKLKHCRVLRCSPPRINN